MPERGFPPCTPCAHWPSPPPSPRRKPDLRPECRRTQFLRISPANDRDTDARARADRGLQSLSIPIRRVSIPGDSVRIPSSSQPAGAAPYTSILAAQRSCSGSTQCTTPPARNHSSDWPKSRAPPKRGLEPAPDTENPLSYAVARVPYYEIDSSCQEKNWITSIKKTATSSCWPGRRHICFAGSGTHTSSP